MTNKKKLNGSSTESSSGSSSGSSSSSSSSGASGTSSSSDSDTSTSRDSTKQHSGSEIAKKDGPILKKSRKSIENKTSANKPPEKISVKTKSQTSKPAKLQIKESAYTTDEEDVKKNIKRKSNVKPKSNATITPRSNPNAPKNVSNTKPVGKSVNTKGLQKGKDAPKPRVQKASSAKTIDPKKKSIFSPDNSSESDSPKGVNVRVKETKKKLKPEPRAKAAARAVEKSKSEKKIEKTPSKSKPAPETSASSGTTSVSSSSGSESESSVESAENSRRIAKKPVKKPSVVQKEALANSDSEIETSDKSKQVTRKLTRSANTRKSKHVLGKNVYSDTDSDTESTKRSLSQSPVKKAPIVTKGKTKNIKREDTKNKNSESIILEQRCCPLEGCDSIGHLSGKSEKHFTLEACPTYHNKTLEMCRHELEERQKREEVRKKALEFHRKTPRPQVTPEQKQFLQKIRDIRLKCKIEPTENKPLVDKTREPDLKNFVLDYDLKLFQDAQALASEKIEEDLKNLPSTKGTKYIEMGKFEMEVWYQSPYPEDYARLPKLYICEYCLRYMKSQTILERHVVKCVWRHPPGEEVYRKDKISVWEVDGKRYKQYCQNLCLLAKFFLDHKTLYYDVEPFLFYVMTLVDNEGCHTVGYFSKEKNSLLNYNVSCILTLPPYQRQGYGRLLIDFSYLLTREEGKIGSPEKPLSDLGLISYRSYWKDVLLGYLCSRAGAQLSVKDISQEMAIHSYDIVSTLQALGMMKYWKGKHIILKKQDVLDEYVERAKKRVSHLKEVDPSCLRWVPPQPASPV
ncbi:LOW QUALITY PROTEIN: histone acetyltransferase KAT7 [Leptinotarsa decemlineata]|uniref:LOW QUALITY PROTEIN: histone acetyltransferase KAT7 n=1 Tax=Leptinotarsa decemlineata TaxID=7539 RepID=UPI003D30D1CD